MQRYISRHGSCYILDVSLDCYWFTNVQQLCGVRSSRLWTNFRLQWGNYPLLIAFLIGSRWSMQKVHFESGCGKVMFSVVSIHQSVVLSTGDRVPCDHGPNCIGTPPLPQPHSQTWHLTVLEPPVPCDCGCDCSWYCSNQASLTIRTRGRAGKFPVGGNQ